MKFADMHCDTLTELYDAGYDIESAPLHISLNGARELSPYVQIAAVWTDKRLTDDEAFRRFFSVMNSFRESRSYRNGKIRFCRTRDELEAAAKEHIPAFVPAIEGARLLGGDITRLRPVAEAGVRLITLQWSGSDCVGGGWDTDLPLTDFGRELITEMGKSGICADISHACDRTAGEILGCAEGTNLCVCASHSNSRTVCSHMRNLTDELFLRVVKSGGIVGLSMAPEHLSDSGSAGIDDICRHLYRYLELGGEEAVCFGCDFDGIGAVPLGLSGIKDIPALYEGLTLRGFSEKTLDKVFFENAYAFILSIME